jgi:hypothetical protein
MLPFSGTRAQYLQGGLCVIFTADGGEELLSCSHPFLNIILPHTNEKKDL